MLFNASRCGNYGESWYCAQAKPGQVQRAYEELVKQNFTAFLPLHRSQTNIVSSLFGSYFFTKFALAYHWEPILSTRGISRLIGVTPARPQPIATSIVENLISRTSDRGVVDDVSLELVPDQLDLFNPGELLRVRTGAFASFEGVCELSSAKRVDVLITMLGTTVRTSLSPWQVEHVSASL